MAKRPEPVVLELATLPREQVGPFLILGLDKSAGKKEMETHWADRVKWARRQIIKTPLEDVNWAREMLNDPEKRVRADAGTLNADTTDGVLARLCGRLGVRGGSAGRTWQPLDREKPLADYDPPAEVPALEEVEKALAVPAVPEGLPGVRTLLEQLVQQPLDPWSADLLPAGPAGQIAPAVPTQDALA
jgi:hypothetical protein